MSEQAGVNVWAPASEERAQRQAKSAGPSGNYPSFRAIAAPSGPRHRAGTLAMAQGLLFQHSVGTLGLRTTYVLYTAVGCVRRAGRQCAPASTSPLDWSSPSPDVRSPRPTRAQSPAPLPVQPSSISHRKFSM